ncbi:OprD family outer membrane porin [Sulfurimonas sp. C5]|uniref:OprD family outer membrane porin n=1 Tax=Sulfurimonas sp. C5 TaxID=3036947 RepID=UPI00245782E7|nr:OprD family outer membrane porin [Sulfurimonas sp. C5]MDH4944465.1 OprD family outer membrane porin [Sulfurimonas sp. C5]
MEKWNKVKLATAATAALLACGTLTTASADDAQPKRSLKGNMMEVYNVLPKSVDSLDKAFTEGVFYGRLRMNSFMWDWKNDDIAGTGNKDNKAFGIGGSMIYKTAPFKGFSATAGMYYSGSPFSGLRASVADLGYIKAGKDTISRYDAKYNGDYYMAVLAQSYLQYDFSKTTVKFGRQIFESFLTKSNDTKMIPNTFDGLVIETKEIPQTRIRGAYFMEQKLRDHSKFHDVITFKDSSGDSWGNNDDSAIHKGLSYANFQAAGKSVDHKLIVADLQNKSINNLQIDVTYGSVPDVVSSITGELNYKIALGSGYTLTPGVRYMKQMDNGGGKIGGACLKGGLAGLYGAQDGYKKAESLDSSLYMARLALTNGPLKAQIAYSAVEDAADIVAPWRGFPTGGYTRAMAQYNWYANTKTMAAEVKYNFGKAKMIPGFTAMVRYAVQNFDDKKQVAGVQADSNIIHVDLLEQITPALSAKLRVGLVSADNRVAGSKAGKDVDSYNEYRFELNYLF